MSHYLRCLQLAEAISDLYDIRFAHSERYGEIVKKAGFQTFPCEGINPQEVMACAKNFDFSWINKDNLERVFQSQVECIQECKPAAVLGDTSPTLKMAAEATQVPYVSLMNGYMTKYYRFVRKIARAHPAVQFEDKLPPRLFDLMVKIGEKGAFRQVHKPFKKIRKKYGLSPQKMYLDELEGDHNLICDLPSLFPQKNLSSNYRFIGPLFYSGQESEQEVLRFLGKGKPNILLSMGSSGDFKKFSFLMGEAYKNINIIVAGNANGALQGNNILSRAFLNNCAILEKVYLMLCHGGNGTIYQSLAFGVPVICSTSIFEQEWNVQRIVDLNLGASLDNISKPEQIKNLISYWMGRKNNNELKSIKEQINLNESKKKFRDFWTQTF